MAINFNNLSNNSQVKQNVDVSNQVKQETASATAKSTEQAKSVRQDSVSLTPHAQKIKELQSKGSDAPVDNEKKIAELKKAIMSGEYKIDPEKLASSISQFEFDLDGVK